MNDVAPPLPPNYELAIPKAGEDSAGWLRAYKNPMDGDTGWTELVLNSPFLHYAEDPKASQWFARPKKASQESVLQEAERLVNGDRQASYGSASESFKRIAKLWTAYRGVEFTPKDVASMMILMKVSRSVTSNKRDNWVDMAGYAELGSKLDD